MLYFRLVLLGIFCLNVSAFLFPVPKSDMSTERYLLKNEKEELKKSSENILSNSNSFISKAKLILPITSILTLNTIDISTTLSDFENGKYSSSRHSISQHYIVNAAKDKSTKEGSTGTKMDPEYEKCLSKCLYTCTKPKGSETRLRADCLPECKEKCAPSQKKIKDKMEMSGSAY